MALNYRLPTLLHRRGVVQKVKDKLKGVIKKMRDNNSGLRMKVSRRSVVRAVCLCSPVLVSVVPAVIATGVLRKKRYVVLVPCCFALACLFYFLGLCVARALDHLSLRLFGVDYEVEEAQHNNLHCPEEPQLLQQEQEQQQQQLLQTPEQVLVQHPQEEVCVVSEVHRCFCVDQQVLFTELIEKKDTEITSLQQTLQGLKESVEYLRGEVAQRENTIRDHQERNSELRAAIKELSHEFDLHKSLSAQTPQKETSKLSKAEAADTFKSEVEHAEQCYKQMEAWFLKKVEKQLKEKDDIIQGLQCIISEYDAKYAITYTHWDSPSPTHTTLEEPSAFFY